jgi:hypothetical protein
MDTVEVDFNKLVAMVDEFEAIDVVVSNEVKVMALLISLLENYQNLITTLENCQPGNWMWDMVNTRLLNEKLMRRERGNIQWDGEVVALMIGGILEVGEIKTRTCTTTVKNKAIKLETARRENKTCKERKSKGTMLIMDFFL